MLTVAATCAPAAAISPTPASAPSVPRQEALPARYRALAVAAPIALSGTDPTQAQAEELWSIVMGWATEVFDHTTDIMGANLAAQIAALEPSVAGIERELTVSVLPLRTSDDTAFVISANWRGLGTFFIIVRAGTSWRVTWNMWRLALNNFPQHNELGRWAFVEAGFHDGSLTGTLYALPATPCGRPRFLVHAMANPLMGGDNPQQVSIWEWDGHELRGQFIGRATWAADFDSDWILRVEGALIRVRSKEPMQALFACGSCSELEAIWTLDVADGQVRDLGRETLTPELALADELIARTRRGAATSELASDQVVRALRAALPKDAREYLGMFTWKIEQRGSGVVLRLEVDELQPLEFSFVRRAGRLFASRLRVEVAKAR